MAYFTVIAVGLAMIAFLVTGCEKAKPAAQNQNQYVEKQCCIAQCTNIEYRSRYDYRSSPEYNCRRAQNTCTRMQGNQLCCRVSQTLYRTCY